MFGGETEHTWFNQSPDCRAASLNESLVWTKGLFRRNAVQIQMAKVAYKLLNYIRVKKAPALPSSTVVTIWTCLKQSSSIKPCDHVINSERLIRLVLLHLFYTSISSASDTVFNFLSDDVLAHVRVWINLAHVLLHRLMSRTSELQQVATGNYVSSTWAYSNWVIQ